LARVEPVEKRWLPTFVADDAAEDKMQWLTKRKKKSGNVCLLDMGRKERNNATVAALCSAHPPIHAYVSHPIHLVIAIQANICVLRSKVTLYEESIHDYYVSSGFQLSFPFLRGKNKSYLVI
jgi:hypothetical protein